MSEQRTIDFFLGANTPEGFCSFFADFDEPKGSMHRYLIKGGPGTGKSGMMRRILQEIQSEDGPGTVERIHCSSDEHSLDAVIWERGDFCIFDATPPHAVEPRYPGAYDRVVAITECWDNEALRKHLPQIIAVSKAVSALHHRCRMLLSAGNMLYQQNRLALSGHWLEEKLHKSSERFAKRLLYGLQEKNGSTHRRFVSALTNNGIITYANTVRALADKIVCIKDDYGVVSERYLSAVKAQANKQGLSMILCMSPFHPGKVDHILFPKQRIAVVTESLFVRFAECEGMQVILASRYLPAKVSKGSKPAFKHRNAMRKALMKDAAECMKQAKLQHDRLEQCYTPAVDFEKVNALTEQVIGEMKKQKPLP